MVVTDDLQANLQWCKGENERMAHIEKFNRAAIGHMLAHYDRGAERIGNECVDRTRSHLNYNLAAELQPKRQGDFIKQRCSEVKVQNRKDVNLMCTWIVTVPKDLPENEHEQFFKTTFDFLSDRYGKENVISAYVHMDETTPHMHFAFIPVVPDKKKQGKFKVSAKERINRFELCSFHFELEQALSAALGHSVGILNGATKDGNKSVTRLKRESQILAQREAERQERVAKTRIQYAEQRQKVADERIETARMQMLDAEQKAREKEHDVAEQIHFLEFIEKQTRELQQEQQDIKKQILQYEQKKAKAEEQARIAQEFQQQEIQHMAEELAKRLLDMDQQIKDAEERLSELKGQILTAEQVKDIGIKKAPFGMALLPYQDALDLKRTAERVNEVDEKEKQAKKIIKDERKILKNAEQEGRERVQNRMREVERELEKKKEEMTRSLKDEIARLKKEIEDKQLTLEIKKNAIEHYISQIEEFQPILSSLIKSHALAQQLIAAEEEKNIVSHETMLKKFDDAKSNYYEQEKKRNDTQQQNHSRRRR